jgi:chemotaxis protein methyltransferase CheR
MNRPDPYEFNHYEIGDKEFRFLKELIYKEAGINLTDAKRCLVQTRIGKLMRKNHISGYNDLFTKLQQETNGKTLELILDSISTNHTFFFREDAHFSYLTDTILPTLVKKHGLKHIKIWSSASSSGEEPYSIGISMMEALQAYPGVSFSIFASDISITVLEKAKKGIYPFEELEGVPEIIKRKYFQRGKGEFADLVKVKSALREKITYARHNLLEPLQQNESFDIIFCRNVMIYFDNPTKEKIVNLLSTKLSMNGYFINGHSESLSAIKHNLTMIKPTIYRRLNG